MQTAAMILTPSDVEALLRDDSAESRVGVLEKVSGHYNLGNLSDREVLIAEQIFRLLMKDAERLVRSSLALKLKANPGVPRDIVLHLANDHHEVATQVLSASSVLSDADLVQIIESTQEIIKLNAITSRPSVSPRLSDALIDTRYPEVISSLLANDGASISEASLGTICSEFVAEESVMMAMAERAHLPAALVDRLMQQASTSVTKALKKRYQFGAALVEKAAHAVQETTLSQILSKPVSDKDMETLIAQMHAEGRLNASIIMTALCLGHLHFVRHALAKLADIPYANATKLLGDKGELGVRALYTRTHMPDSMYGAVSLLVAIAHELESQGIAAGSQAYSNMAVERLLSHPRAKDVDNLPYIMALLRGGPRR